MPLSPSMPKKGMLIIITTGRGRCAGALYEAGLVTLLGVWPVSFGG